MPGAHQALERRSIAIKPVATYSLPDNPVSWAIPAQLMALDSFTC